MSNDIALYLLSIPKHLTLHSPEAYNDFRAKTWPKERQAIPLRKGGKNIVTFRKHRRLAVMCVAYVLYNFTVTWRVRAWRKSIGRSDLYLLAIYATYEIFLLIR